MQHTAVFRDNLQDVLASIINQGRTTDEIAKECGMSRTTLRNYLQYLRKNRQIYICGYKRSKSGNRPIAVYKFGCLEDVPLDRRTEYKPKKREISTVVPKIPRCDIAAAWMLNPISEDVCQS